MYVFACVAQRMLNFKSHFVGQTLAFVILIFVMEETEVNLVFQKKIEVGLIIKKTKIVLFNLRHALQLRRGILYICTHGIMAIP